MIVCRRWLNTKPFVSRLESTPRVQGGQSRRLLRRAALPAAAGMAGMVLYHTDDDARHVFKAIHRCGQAGWTGARVALDYQWTWLFSRDAETTSACHTRNAQRVLRRLQDLGGIYVKWGQHLSSMIYILPEEWTSTLAALQDRCDVASSPEEIRDMFRADFGQELETVFDVFDEKPIGVASLAQVHRARLRQTGEWVAVKFQHPSLDEFCRIDIDTVTWIFGTIKRLFPSFGFEWVAHDMRENLPKELDFTLEADNAHQVATMFEHDKTALVIPKVLWAKRRILCMEFVEGARIDDTEYMKAHGINPSSVSTELMTIFSKMMFLHGFVHCDPHPGNIMIRAHPDNGNGFNFDLVLLDHGVYRTLSDTLRLDYAHLWTSLIEGDEEGIKQYCARVGGSDHRLFASLLTGREWHTIHSAKLSAARTQEEVERVANKQAPVFLKRITDILSSLPRVMLLLLKTGDLLRNVDEKLRLAAGPQQYMTFVVMGRYCAKAVWLDTKEGMLERLRQVGASWSLLKHFMSACWHYHWMELNLWITQSSLLLRERLKLCLSADT